MQIVKRIVKRVVTAIVNGIVGDPRDWAPSNACFLGFAIPALAGIVGSIFKKKSQDSAAKQQMAQQQQQQQYEMQQRMAQINAYNQQRTQDVQGKRDLLKAYMMSKGYDKNPLFANMGGFDNFFSRPIRGLQDANMLQAAPIFRPQTESWWNVGGQGLGALGSAAGSYFGAREQNNQFKQAGGGGNLGQGGGGGLGMNLGQTPNFSLNPKPPSWFTD